MGEGSPAELLRQDGYVLLPGAIASDVLLEMMPCFAASSGQRHTRIAPELLARIVHHPHIAEMASELGFAGARLVRIIAFDKSPAANWMVPWHQDRTIAVRDRVEQVGYERWTVKDGTHHVEPPVALLESILTLRIHMDHCGIENGPLEVLPGTHTAGRLDSERLRALTEETQSVLCCASAGDVLAMRPLTVHRSGRAQRATHRRVLHLELSTADLPQGLAWAIGAAAPTLS